MAARGIFYEFWIKKCIAFIKLKKKNDFVHHVDIQVKIFKPSSLQWQLQGRISLHDTQIGPPIQSAYTN